MAKSSKLKKIKFVFEDLEHDSDAINFYLEGDINNLAEANEETQTTAEYYAALMFQLCLDTMRDLGAIDHYRGPEDGKIH